MTKKLIRKTVLMAGYSCNNSCVFCMEAGRRRVVADRPTAELLREIAEARKRGSEYLEIIGGEATIRPDICALLDFARRQGFRTIMMATNGRLLSYPDFAKKLAEAGLTEVVFSIHGHNASLHDSLTRAPGSFAQLVKGVKNIREAGVGRIGANCTVTRKNYRSLPAIGRLLLKLGIKNAEFIFVDCNEGGAREHFDELVPRISDAAPYMRRMLALGVENGVQDWTVRYVPLCHFQGYGDYISEVREASLFRTEHVAPEFRNMDVSEGRRTAGRVKGPQCRACSLNDMCEGIWREYAARFGLDELKAVKK